MSNCVLCGSPLAAYPTNKEHYVPQVLIREFGTLGIPKNYDWAIRSNHYTLNTEISVPISEHKKWAVVVVHEKCNLEASAMCRDLRYIIDHIDEDFDIGYAERPILYYAKLWRSNAKDIEFIINGAEKTRKRLIADKMLLYRPGLLDCGRLIIKNKMPISCANDYEWHTITIGLEGSIREL